MSRPRLLSFALSLTTAAVAASFIGSTCDLAADECNQPEDNRCDGNTVVTCSAPGAEVHRRLSRRECGAGTTCSMTEGHVAECVPTADAGFDGAADAGADR